MLPRRITYAKTGVDRKLRAYSKKGLQILSKTYRFSRRGRIIRLPYGNVFPSGKGDFLDFQIEGVGTKVLLAQLAEKYDTVGVDGVAMAVNDVIRSGARPLAIVDNIHSQASDPVLVGELLKGIADGAEEAECVVPAGEIGDVADLIAGLSEGKGFDMIVAAVGEVSKDRMIYGTNIKSGDTIVGLRSSGLHSNGITLARKVLFKQWGGRYGEHDVPDGFDTEVVLEALKPTSIYVKPFLEVAEESEVKGAVHVTGDAYLKFERLTEFSRGIGFEFDNYRPQPIFELIQKTAVDMGGKITDEEMFKTFNMGWGFALIVEKVAADKVLDILAKAKVEAEPIGHVTGTAGVKIKYRGRKIILS